MESLDELMEELRARVEARRDAASHLGRSASMEEVFRVIRAKATAARVGDAGGVPEVEDSADLDMSFELPVLETPAWASASLPALAVAPPAGVPEGKDSYALAELLELGDVDFVRSAYVALLRRNPDPEGLATYVEALRSGAAKVDVLWAFRQSEEGRKHNVPVRGLAWAYRIHRLSGRGFLGYLVKLVRDHLALPRIADRLGRLERDAAARASSLEDAWRGADQVIAAAFAARDAQLVELSRASTTRYALEAMAARMVDTGVAVVHAHEAVRELRARMADVQHEAVAAVLDRLEKAMVALDEATAKTDLVGRIAERVETRSQALEAAIESVKSTIQGQLNDLEHRVDESVGASMPDDFYVSFEDRFRGSLADIRERVQVYVPILAGSGAGMSDRPILDIGCGRGELLEVLAANGLQASGVDLNKAMVDECAGKGLRVVQADAVGLMKSVAAGSLGGVTGLHVIEHLPFSRLVGILDATFRALKPGGVAIFETPNPENVAVGSCNFWYDPTHRAPLPPALMDWLARSRGFGRVEVMRLHPAAEQLRTSEGDKVARGILNERFNGPQDYAIIAYKS